MTRKIYILLLTLLSNIYVFAAKLPTVPYKAPPLPSDPGEELSLGTSWVLLIFVLFYLGYRVLALIKIKK